MINTLKIFIISIATFFGLYQAPINEVRPDIISTQVAEVGEFPIAESVKIKIETPIKTTNPKIEPKKEISEVETYYPDSTVLKEFNITSEEFINQTRLVSTSTTQTYSTKCIYTDYCVDQYYTSINKEIVFVTDLPEGKTISWTTEQKEIDLKDYFTGYDAPKVYIDFICSTPPENPNVYGQNAFSTCVLKVSIDGKTVEYPQIFNIYK